jgi:diguanylate cyclase (GGDEF)-like protein
VYRKLPEPLRANVERQLIVNLFQQRNVILVGGIASAGVSLLAFLRTHQVPFLLWMLCALVILGLRMSIYWRFNRLADDSKPLRSWRLRFAIGTWLNAACTGGGGAYSILASDVFTQMLMVTQLVSFVMGSAARNYTHPQVVRLSILLAEGPLICALVETKDVYYMIEGAFAVLLALASLAISRDSYNQTVSLLVTTTENDALLEQIKESNRELSYAASHDKLTGLANRAQFMKHLEAAIERVRAGGQQGFTLMFLDFDHFKLVNDTLGHEAGDELLRQIADRLENHECGRDRQSAIDDSTVVGRFGGDEFLLLFNHLPDLHGAERLAERLLAALEPTYEIRNTEVKSSASIGIVTSGRCLATAEDMIRNADVAMFEAKRAGRACWVMFNDSMRERLDRHVAIENGLRRAIGTHEMYLLYQPIVDLATGRMASAEALVRWNHPTLGNVSPAEFIPIAEENPDLIIALGRWAQVEACRAFSEWLRVDPAKAPATISVNLSRAELARGPLLLDRIRSMLAREGFPADRLQLEVTEREVMRDPTGARAVLEELRTLGVRLAMDDFGTGTSSLALLREFPFDTIKIDRSFVKDVAHRPDVLAVIHATIGLVENLGMVSVAEGVEDSAQAAILQSLGCRMAQGYLFSGPVAEATLLETASNPWVPAAQLVDSPAG